MSSIKVRCSYAQMLQVRVYAIFGHGKVTCRFASMGTQEFAARLNELA